MLYAACSVVERDWFNTGAVAEKVAALIKRNGMREHFAQRRQLHAGGGDKIVHDAQPEFRLHKNFAGDQKICVLGDRAGQRVLDGDDGGGDGAALNAVKHFDRSCARNNRAARQHALSGFVAEGTEFALNGDFGGGKFRHKAR